MGDKWSIWLTYGLNICEWSCILNKRNLIEICIIFVIFFKPSRLQERLINRKQRENHAFTHPGQCYHYRSNMAATSAYRSQCSQWALGPPCGRSLDLLRPPNLMLVLAQLVTLQWHTGRELGEFCSLVRVRRQKDHSPMLTNGDFSIFGFDFLCINVPQSRKFLLLHEDRKLLYMTEVFFSRKTIISCAYDRIKM